MKEQCPYIYVSGSGEEYYNCGKDAGHDLPHLDCYDVLGGLTPSADYAWFLPDEDWDRRWFDESKS